MEVVTGQYRWYLFSNEVKQMLPMMLINLQQPIQIQCFGSLSCCRDAFKKVKYIDANVQCETFSFI